MWFVLGSSTADSPWQLAGGLQTGDAEPTPTGASEPTPTGNAESSSTRDAAPGEDARTICHGHISCPAPQATPTRDSAGSATNEQTDGSSPSSETEHVNIRPIASHASTSVRCTISTETGWCPANVDPTSSAHAASTSVKVTSATNSKVKTAD